MSEAKKAPDKVIKPVRLLKKCVVKVDADGVRHVYNNLYLQLGEGSPIAIDLPAKKFNMKIKNLLLANAVEFETSTSVSIKADDEAKDF